MHVFYKRLVGKAIGRAIRTPLNYQDPCVPTSDAFASFNTARYSRGVVLSQLLHVGKLILLCPWALRILVRPRGQFSWAKLCFPFKSKRFSPSKTKQKKQVSTLFVSIQAIQGCSEQNMAKWAGKMCVNMGFCKMHLLSLEANVRFWTQGGPEICSFNAIVPLSSPNILTY